MQTNRRNFIGNAAILTAGLIMTKTKVFATFNNNESGLEKNWKRFCKKNKGVTSYNNNVQHYLTPCAGHQYKEGVAVHFSKADVTALPVWVYWENDQSQPADLLIIFRKNKHLLTCINQYELSALLSLDDSQNAFDKLFKLSNNNQRVLFSKTKIANNSPKISLINNKDINTNNQLV